MSPYHGHSLVVADSMVARGGGAVHGCTVCGTEDVIEPPSTADFQSVRVGGRTRPRTTELDLRAVSLAEYIMLTRARSTRNGSKVVATQSPSLSRLEFTIARGKHRGDGRLSG